MILKQREQGGLPTDPRLRAGAQAEQQMAFYLHRAFSDEQGVYVLNDLRLVDPQQPEHDGSPAVCQIDHLVLHRWGLFIIESKSVYDEVTVRSDGAGGDEWTRRFKGRTSGFPSPIQQARRQGDFLRAFLQRHREQLLGKVGFGFRTVFKALHGTDQRGFLGLPMQIIVAISDAGKIKRVNRWKEPDGPFRTFVSKSDLVSEKIQGEIERHRQAASPLNTGSEGEYGEWAMKAEEVSVVAAFLASQHAPAASSPPPAARAEVFNAIAERPVAAKPACQSCGEASLTGKWGKYGYYWKCGDCGTNTPMATTCSACGTTGKHGKGVRIRKQGPTFYRDCKNCGTQEQIQ